MNARPDQPATGTRLTGLQHHQRAEALLDYCQKPDGADMDEHGRFVECYPCEPADEDGVDVHRNALMAAQVHATLALASAVRGDHMPSRYVAGIGGSQ